jgi:type I restriction enzyme M protein
VIVPDGVLFGSSKAHKELRRKLVEDQKLDAVVKLPGGVFKPYAGVSTAILFFTKTNSGGTDHVWFYDLLARWFERDGSELGRARTDQSFCIPKADIAATGYDLSINRYQEVVHDEAEHRPPHEILADLAKLEDEIKQGLSDLEGML